MGSAEVQGQLWGTAARDWAEMIEHFQTPMYEAAFEAVKLEHGTRLLDAGCGAGLALQLAEQQGAIVTGFDASAGLLEVARERVPDADIRQGDLETLPFDDRSFDAITAFNSVQYSTDPTRALREIKRVAKPGASVAIATWGNPEHCDTAVLLAAIGSVLPPPPPGAEGPFALAAPGALEALVEGAGLTAEHAIDVTVSFVFPDLETGVRAQLSSGPARKAIEHSGLEATRTAIAGSYAASQRPDGTYRQNNEFRVVIARA
jgi:SAM-dependent methyltransferase